MSLKQVSRIAWTRMNTTKQGRSSWKLIVFMCTEAEVR